MRRLVFLLASAVLGLPLAADDAPVTSSAPTYAQVERLIEAVGVGPGGRHDTGVLYGDETTVTTNVANGAVLAGRFSLAGVRTAATGSIPHKAADGTLSWIPEHLVTVVGSNGTTVTEALCTNRLIFASAPDSNVKFTVTGDDHGNVTVTVGVYYK